MKKLLLFICILGGVQLLWAQDATNSNDALSVENHALLSKLVMSDHHQAVNQQKSTPKPNNKKSTAKAVSSFLTTNTPNGNGQQGKNVDIFVIKDSKSKIVKTKPIKNKPMTKEQTQALHAVLGIKQ